MKACFAALLALTMMQASHADSFKWPGGARAAVSLSYDDALSSQLDNALPALNAHGLKATFYLTLASDTVAKRLPEWRRAATQGHELGNHTLYHPCSRSKPGRDWVAPHRDLDKISVAQLREEILLANAYLQAIDGRTERTYTAPCGDLLAGGQPYLPSVKSLFVAIKSRGGSGVAPSLAAMDPHDLGSADPTGLDGPALIAIVERAAAAGSFASITFHGVGGDYLTVSKEAHAALLAHLAAHPERFWVESLVKIMSFASAQH